MKNHESSKPPGSQVPSEAAQKGDVAQNRDENQASNSPQPKQDQPNSSDDVLRFKDLAMRAQADLENYRKRTIREKEEAIRYANTSLLQKLLPILDSFELGLEAARTASDPVSIAKGMEMVQKQLQDFLRDHGVEVVPADGEVFDPTKHEAISQEHHSEIPEGHIVRQLRKGYKLKDRLLRASTVTVSKGAAE